MSSKMSSKMSSEDKMSSDGVMYSNRWRKNVVKSSLILTAAVLAVLMLLAMPGFAVVSLDEQAVQMAAKQCTADPTCVPSVDKLVRLASAYCMCLFVPSLFLHASQCLSFSFPDPSANAPLQMRRIV